MNSDNLTQFLQQGFRLTLGATASLVETLQDPQKQRDNIDRLQSELNHLAREWAAKGEMTEQEARDFVDNLLHQRSRPTPAASSPTVTTTPTQAAPPDLQLELQELTAQIAAIRTELEKLQNPDSNPS